MSYVEDFEDMGGQLAVRDWLESNELWDEYEHTHDKMSLVYLLTSEKSQQVRKIISCLTPFEIIMIAIWMNENPSKVSPDNRYKPTAMRIAYDKVDSIYFPNNLKLSNSQRRCLIAYIRPAILQMP